MTSHEKLIAAYKETPWLEDIAGLEVLEEGEWEQDHKYQHRSSVVLFEGQTFDISESRSGSYHTDWYYDSSYITPVEAHKEVRTVVIWKGCGPRVEVDR